MNDALTVKKAIDLARQNEAVKKAHNLLRSILSTGGSSNLDVVQGQGVRKINKHSQRKPKTSRIGKVRSLREITRSPLCVQHSFKCKKMGHFSAMCRSAKTVETIIKNVHSDVAFLGEMDEDDHG